jgi:iron(II)-dependent oxidoreductase
VEASRVADAAIAGKALGNPFQIGSSLNTMVLVPAGEFIMGSSEKDIQDILRTCDTCKRDWYIDETPRRRVYLDTYYIDKYPVTNSGFRRFGKPDYNAGAKFNGPRQPVVGVTWTQARDYCKSAGKRLPTEAEWEKAARGVDGRKYPWGNQWDPSKIIWHKNSKSNDPWLKSRGRMTHPVDRTYKTHRSPFGAVDMVGNVWEWVQDRYRPDHYRTALNRNPKGPATGIRRVVRGGSWFGINASWFRAAHRDRDPPDSWDFTPGFRCAKNPLKAPSVFAHFPGVHSRDALGRARV